ncbi:MAG: hypothetical protein SF162_12130 [bacterium]|nr:hypothetical protein [bacterium]
MRSCRSVKLLDLFCGGGLAAWGYWRSGRFTEIIGVDINGDMRDQYAFDFLQADALSLTYEFLMQFDLVHASPPCQAYSYLTPNKSLHPRLILPVKHMLYAAGIPHVIENVPGSAAELRPNVEMNGHYFGLLSDRPRYFYVSGLQKPLRWVRRRGSDMSLIKINGAEFVNRAELIRGMGLTEMISPHRLKMIRRRAIEEGIPPLMTKAIAELVIRQKAMIG